MLGYVCNRYFTHWVIPQTGTSPNSLPSEERGFHCIRLQNPCQGKASPNSLVLLCSLNVSNLSKHYLLGNWTPPRLGVHRSCGHRGMPARRVSTKRLPLDSPGIRHTQRFPGLQWNHSDILYENESLSGRADHHGNCQLQGLALFQCQRQNFLTSSWSTFLQNPGLGKGASCAAWLSSRRPHHRAFIL